MTSYFTIQPTADGRPRRFVPQDFARLFAEEEPRIETRVERFANATRGLLGPLRAKLLAFWTREAKSHGYAPRAPIRAVSA